ncbi:MAG: hypothetical protein VB875_06650 [Pirellulales bacterium]
MDRVCKKIKAAAYVLAPLLCGLIALAATYCFLPMLVASPWMGFRPVVFTMGSLLVVAFFGAVYLLNRCVPIKTIFSKCGVFLFCIAWAIPILSLVSAIACTVAAANGFEFEASGSHDWDWD